METKVSDSQEVKESPPSLPSETKYQALPLVIALHREPILDKILSNMIRFENMFTDYQKNDETRKRSVVANFMKPDSLTWEVWKLDAASLPVDLVGILHLSEIRLGQDAIAHYVFFDEKLSGKTNLINTVIDWAFEDHPESGWEALNRITVMVPDMAFALARHARRYLGFGGPFTYKIGRKSVQLEGIKRNAIRWHGQKRDLLFMGRLNASS